MGQDAAAAAEDLLDFALRPRQVDRVGHRHGDDGFFNLRPELLEGLVGDDDELIDAGAAQQAFVLLPDTHHAELHPVQAHNLADGIEGAEERIGNGQAQNGHPLAVGVLVVGEHPAVFDGEDRHGYGQGGLGAAHDGVLHLLVAEADVVVVAEEAETSLEGGDDGATGALLAQGADVFVDEVLAQANLLRPLLEGEGGKAGDEEDAGADLLHLAGDVGVQAVDDGGHADDREHADHHPQHGERRAQLVGADGAHGGAQVFPPGDPHHSALKATAGSRWAARTAG